MLCDLEIDIVCENIISTLQFINFNKLIVPFSVDTAIQKVANLLAKEIDIKLFYNDKFADIKARTQFNQFFKILVLFREDSIYE